MSIYIGRQITNELDLYNSSNKLYLKSKISSNILYLNYHSDSFSNACMVFRNDYQFGYINDKLTFYKSSNLLTIDNNLIQSYKNVIFHSNIEIIDYYKTSNNINHFNNNLLLNFNDISDTFKINYMNNTELVNINKNSYNIYNSNTYTSNLTIHPDCILYTNYIDSPNLNPVVIRNMAFAESLRIITANIVHSLNIDTRIIFNNYANLMPNDTMNITTPFDLATWNNYVIDNHINANDLLFAAPNIDIKKIITNYSNVNNIGGDNILEFKIYNGIQTSNTTKVLSINNSGYINIGNTCNLDTPLIIKINPINSNIIQYTNLNNSNKNFCVGSNGYINIGTSNLSSNQLYITKYDVNEPTNTELISLNINYNNTLATYGINGNNQISFINNDTLTDFNIIEYGNDTYIITNNYISNNINYDNINIYNINHYSSLLIELPNMTSAITSNLYIEYPNNGFNITSNITDNNNNIDVNIIIHPIYISPIPIIFNPDNYNKITKTKIIENKNIYNNFYIYKSTFIFNYNGLYKNTSAKLISASSNNNIIYSISHNGNIGIGTNFTDKYKLYIPENGLINNIDCSTISNYLRSNISFQNNNLNNIKILNSSNINANIINSTSNNLNVINNNNININSNIKVLSSGFLDVNSISSFGYSNIRNNYIMNINVSSNNGNAIIIYNQFNNINPNLLLFGDNDISNPYMNLKNRKIDVNIKITSNFEITTSNISNNNNTSLLFNDITNNYVSLYNNNLTIFKDNDNNVKIFTGTPKFNNNISIDPVDWFNSIKNNGLISSYPSFNSYGDLNLRNTFNNPIITSSTISNKIRIGIGTEPPSLLQIFNMNIDFETNFTSNVYINNNLYISGTVLTPSDSNIKSNIKKINNPIEKISNINGYTYTRIDTGNIETGLLAQEVIEILPEVITYNEITKLYNISYGNLCGLLIEGIKELNERIKKLEK